MNKLVILSFLFLTSCTYSITMVHTEGLAADVIDESATATGNIPISIVPKPTL